MIKKAFLVLFLFVCGFCNDQPMQFSIHSSPYSTEIKDSFNKSYLVKKDYFQNTLRLEMYLHDKLLFCGNILFYENAILNFIYDEQDIPYAVLEEKNNAWFSPRTYSIRKKNSNSGLEEPIYTAEESYWGTKLNIYDETHRQVAVLYKPWFDSMQKDWTLVFKDYWSWNTQIKNKKNLYLLLLMCAYEVDKTAIDELKKSFQN